MIVLPIEHLAEAVIARILNSIPEGLLIALLVGMILRFLPRHDSATRFAAWFLALLAVIALPFAGSFVGMQSVLRAGSHSRPLLTLPGHWASIIFIGWLLIAGLGTLRLAAGVWRVHSLLRTCLAVNTSDLEPAIGKIVREFSRSKSVTIMTSENVSVPTAVGFMRPKIVVPRWALRELAPQDLNVVLLHEFAHLRRRDGWTNLLQKLLRTVFCFHPAVWWIESRLSLEREMACDDYVVAETNDSRGYAKCLIGLLERRLVGNALALAQAAVHRVREATLRVAQILDVNRANTKCVCKPALAVVAVFSLLCLVVLPEAGQVVGFRANDRFQDHDALVLPLSDGTAPLTARVVPAGIEEISVPLTRKQSRGKTIAGAKTPLAIKPHALMARAPTSSGPADVTTVRATYTATPVEWTVLVIRTRTQNVPEAWQWSIRVWRLMVVPDCAPNAAVARKT
jgi:beta-lactamase regulating signal transducer with metallopeptidase domain